MQLTVSDARMKPENDVTKMVYSSMEDYYTYNGNTGEYSWESEYGIANRHSKIPSGSLDEWIDAVMEYINDYNSSLPEQTVTYEVFAVRTNAMYNYKKYINGTLVDEGWADYGMIDEDEIEAWADAVVGFRKKNNLSLPTDEINESLEKTKEERNNPNSPFDRNISGNLPNIPDAISSMTSEPCEFPAKITEAIKTGPTGPIDQMKATLQGKKQEICQSISMDGDDFNENLGSLLDPVLETIEDQTSDMTNEEMSMEEYYRKKFAQERGVINDALADQDLIRESGESAYLSSGGGSIYIPDWMEENIKNAMHERYGSNNDEPAKGVMDLYNSYKSYFCSTFESQGVPIQLTVLSIIESGCGYKGWGNTENGSTAKGIWQFIRSTGAAYGLVKLYSTGAVIPGTDKRTDYKAATPAAAKALKKFRTNYGFTNWIYVAASYNAGQGPVLNAIKKAGAGADIWSVWKRFPAIETRNYVCLLIGLCRFIGMSIDPLFS